MTVSDKHMWISINLAGNTSTPTVATIKAFCQANNVRRLIVDMSASVASGNLVWYDHIFLAQLKAALLTIPSVAGVSGPCELWAGLAGNNLASDSTMYLAATRAVRLRIAADLTVVTNTLDTSIVPPVAGKYNPNYASANDNWPYTGTAKTTPLFVGVATDLEAWSAKPWPGGTGPVSTAYCSEYLGIVSNVSGELRTTTAGYKLYFNGGYTLTNAPASKHSLWVWAYHPNKGWNNAAPTATDNMATHIFPWVDEVVVMGYDTGTSQETLCKPSLAIANGLSNILRTSMAHDPADYSTKAALKTDVDTTFTNVKAAGSSYSKLSAGTVWEYSTWNALP